MACGQFFCDHFMCANNTSVKMNNFNSKDFNIALY